MELLRNWSVKDDAMDKSPNESADSNPALLELVAGVNLKFRISEA